MAKREKFGKFVLLDEVEASGLGMDYRAAKLGSAGLEKIVSVLRIKPSLSGNADAVKSLMDQVKLAAQLQNPNVLKIYGIGKVDAAYYISYEFMEGKSLRSIFNRCRQEGFPFSVDHALLICSKICSALEYAHGRKAEGGGRYFHGLLTPASVIVSYEGEVRVRGFGYWPSKIREAGALTDEDSQYLAPEQAAGGAGDPRSDIFAIGAILFETLTGEPLLQGARMQDIAGRLTQARLQNPTTDDDSLPKPIAEILLRSLAEEPGGRFGEIQEVRKAIDTLLFSGDFTPTTFNLAFFMHSLFREDIEREGRALKDDKDANYAEFLDDSKPAMLTPVPRSEPVAPEAVAATVMVPTPVPAARPAPPAPPPAQVHHEPEPPRAPAKEAAAPSFSSFDKAPPAASKAPMLVIGAVVLIGLAAAGYFMFGSKGPATPSPAASVAPSTLSADQIRLKELEQKLADIEAVKKAEEDKATEETKKKLEAKAKAEGTKVDPEELKKAQEAAATKARAEAEKKAAEEKARLEAEQKAARDAEEKRLAEEKARADEAARTAAAATLAPVTTAAAAAPAVKPGDLVKLSDPGVLPPLAEKKGQLEYPAIARTRRIEGVVGISALVDERGMVIDAKVVNEVGGKAGLNEAALEYVKKWKFRPATLGGVPVKVWASVNVKFSLQ